MKVLVTGASGGLGRLIINELLKREVEVVATSRDSEKVKGLNFPKHLTYIPFDIGNNSVENLFEFFGKPDLVIHLAWENLHDFKTQTHINKTLPEHKRFIRNLISNGLRSLTVAGTCYEYGLREGELEETMPSEPVLSYPKAKNELLHYVDQLKSEFSFSLKWLRIFYVFGEVEGRKNLYTMLQAAIENKEKQFNMSGGEQIRDFLTPGEIAAYFVTVAIQNEVEGIINCCSGEPIKLIDKVNNFLSEKKVSLKLNLGFYPYPDYEPMKTWGNTQKLKNALGSKKITNFKP